MEKMLTTKQAAVFLGVSTKSIKNWRKSGKLIPTETRENGYSLYSLDQLGNFKAELGNKVGKVGNFPTSQTREKVAPTRETRESGENQTREDDFQTRETTRERSPLFAKTGEATGEATGEVGNKTRETNFSFPTSTRENPSETGENISKTRELNSQTREDENFSQPEFSQHLENLPAEFLAQPRFFPVKIIDGKKIPLIKDWTNPDNQKIYTEIHGALVGFDISGYDIRTNYLFLDFDHVLLDGKFVADSVALFVDNLRKKFPNIFIEVSQSGTGLHVFFLPSSNLFGTFAAGNKSTLYFSDDRSKNAPKLEVFYNTGGRYCLVSGNKFAEGSDIPSGAPADDFFNFIIAEIDKQQPKQEHKQSNNYKSYKADSDSPSEQVRALAMLDKIPCSLQTYPDWVAVGMILKNNGNTLADWESWSATDSARFKDGECEKKWLGFKDFGGLTIATLYKLAAYYGYDEKDFRRKWYRDNEDFQTHSHSQKSYSDDNLDDLYRQLDDIKSQIADFQIKKVDAIETLKNVEKFDKDIVFADDILTAAAFAFLYDKMAYSNFKAAIQNQIKEQKTDKFIIEWQGEVRGRAKAIQADYFDLLAKKNEIIAKIKNAEFIKDNDSLKGFIIPDGYSLSAELGIEKIIGKDVFQICRRVIVINGIAYNVEDKTYKLILRYLNNKWHSLQPVGEGTIFNTRKVVDLADFHLPVTSVNAKGIVEFLDAFKCLNEDIFPLFYIVPRCGWYNFNNKVIFVDPRRKNFIDVNEKKVEVTVNSSNTFALSLKQKGSVAD